jgi:uncharacterized protein YukE
MDSENSFDSAFITAVNEKEMIAINTKLQNDIDYISKIFSNLDDMVAESKGYFKGDLADVFFHKYTQYQLYYKRIIENLDSFREDLVNVKLNYKGKSDSIKTSEVNVNEEERLGELSGIQNT